MLGLNGKTQIDKFVNIPKGYSFYENKEKKLYNMRIKSKSISNYNHKTESSPINLPSKDNNKSQL